MNSPFVVSVAKLMRDIPSTATVNVAGPFDARHEFAPRGAAESDIDADAEVAVAVQLESFSGGLRVHGRLGAPWFGLCRRCSAPVTGRLDVTVDERYVDHAPPGDDEAYPIEHEMIDLTPLVHDALLLELPLAPLCREDCRGLCPYCGIDRNEATCACTGPVDPRWATLDGLRFSEDDESSPS